MASKTKIILIDDIDKLGGATVKTVQFGFEGKSYEIELNNINYQRLSDYLGEFIEHARPVAGSRAHRTRTRSDVPAIRAWAAEQGIPIGDRGRIPAAVRAAYEAAHSADGRTLGAVA